MIAVRDRLKLLECNQKASNCYISDLWSNTSREQLQLSAHIPVWLLFYSQDGTFLSRGSRDWNRIGILLPLSEALETSEWRGYMLILASRERVLVQVVWFWPIACNHKQRIVKLHNSDMKHNEDEYKHFWHARNNRRYVHWEKAINHWKKKNWRQINITKVWTTACRALHTNAVHSSKTMMKQVKHMTIISTGGEKRGQKNI